MGESTLQTRCFHSNCVHVYQRSKATEQDWMKLKRALDFLNGTVYDVLTLGAESLEELLNFVDVSFATHFDMRSHAGGGASFGRGCSCACQGSSA